MAQGASRQEITTRIDWSLDYLLNEWADIPTLAAEEWPLWSRNQQVEFFLDWSVKEDRLHALRQWQAEGQITAAQAARFAALLRLIARHGPVLDALSASRDAPRPESS